MARRLASGRGSKNDEGANVTSKLSAARVLERGTDDGVSQPVMACLILLFLDVCAALAAGIIKGTSTTGFFRIGSDILTAGRYWPVLVVIAVLIFSALANRKRCLCPLQARRFAEAHGTRAKTDAVDARDWCSHGRRNADPVARDR